MSPLRVRFGGPSFFVASYRSKNPGILGRAIGSGVEFSSFLWAAAIVWRGRSSLNGRIGAIAVS
jgi:hypothetical protein